MPGLQPAGAIASFELSMSLIAQTLLNFLCLGLDVIEIFHNEVWAQTHRHSAIGALERFPTQSTHFLWSILPFCRTQGGQRELVPVRNKFENSGIQAMKCEGSC